MARIASCHRKLSVNQVGTMRVFVVVNRVAEIGFRQTTALLIAALVRNRAQTTLVDVDQISAGDEGSWQPQPNYWACGYPLDGQIDRASDFDSLAVARLVRSLPQATAQTIRTGDLMLIRTNPGRDLGRLAVHDSFLDVCQSARRHGVRIVNDPTNIRFLAGKSSLLLLPSRFRPTMLISQQPQTVIDFVRQAGVECVIKPLIGTRGQGIIRCRGDEPYLQDHLEQMLKSQAVVAQHFLRSDYEGDKRIVVMGGEILKTEGAIGGIQRVPADGDFRANLHAGGTALPLCLDDAEKSAVNAAARLLFEHGIWLAGIDLVGDRVIEFNVFSTGGLYDASRFAGVDFAELVVQKLLACNA
jgi:glutathione synthase